MTEEQHNIERERVLRAKGYRVVSEEFDPMPTGKSFRAKALAEKLMQEGKAVEIVDGLFRNRISGVRVWAKG